MLMREKAKIRIMDQLSTLIFKTTNPLGQKKEGRLNLAKISTRSSWIRFWRAKISVPVDCCRSTGKIVNKVSGTPLMIENQKRTSAEEETEDPSPNTPLTWRWAQFQTHARSTTSTSTRPICWILLLPSIGAECLGFYQAYLLSFRMATYSHYNLVLFRWRSMPKQSAPN